MARTIIAGGSGNGKSWEFGRVLENIVPQFTHAVHIDIENEEKGLSKPGEDGSGPIYYSFYVDRQGLSDWNIPETIRTQKKLRIVPDDLMPQEITRLTALVSRTAMEIAQHDEFNFYFSADEAHSVMPKHGLDDDISRLLTGGRKRGIEWAVATQRLANIHEDAITQASHGFYFGMGGTDAQKVNSYTVFDARKQLSNLDKREYIREDRNAGEWHKVDTNRLSRAHPHEAADDGIADEFFAQQIEQQG